MDTSFLSALAESMDIELDEIGTPAVTVKGHVRRAGSQLAVGYTFGDRLVLSCDPTVEAMLQAETIDMEPTLDAWGQRGPELDGELLGRARMQLLGSREVPQMSLPAGYALRSLDPLVAADRALIEHLVATSDADDLDDAEIELDNLDSVITVVLDPSGEIATYASSRPFDLAAGFQDIGIMTRPQDRSVGLGRAAVAEMCQRIWADGFEPLYRCEEDNAGSVALSAGLGFVPATQLVAFRFPVPLG